MLINAAFYGEHSHHTAAHGGATCCVCVYVDRQLEDSKASLKHSPNNCVPVAAAVLHVVGDFMRDFSTKLVPLLEDDIRVMIYAGRLFVDKQLCVYVFTLMRLQSGQGALHG